MLTFIYLLSLIICLRFTYIDWKNGEEFTVSDITVGGLIFIIPFVNTIAALLFIFNAVDWKRTVFKKKDD